jgi:hypothetical protein
MANYRRRKTGLICLFLLFSCLLVNVTIADSVNEREGSPKPETSAIQRNRPEQSLRGGSELLLPLKWAVGVLKTATIGPLVKPTVILLGKFTIIAFITAEIMAYLGLIGDSGEGLYDWALDNEERVHSFIRKWGVRPGGFLRSRLESMLQSYNALPPKAKFASAVSAGTTAFPFILRTSLWSGATVLGSFLFVEFLCFVGVLGDVGEGLGEWVSDGGSEPILRTVRRIAVDVLPVLRQKLKILELVHAFWSNIKNDRVFWAGFGVGATASVVLPICYD